VRAQKFAESIGSYHIALNMDSMVTAILMIFETVTGKRPVYKVFGGSDTENLALQNIQVNF
jgi:NAD+ synthase (glutamine-hydrolysing)